MPPRNPASRAPRSGAAASGGRRTPSAPHRGRPAPRGGGPTWTRVLVPVGLVVAVIVGLVIAKVAGGGGSSPSGTSTASAEPVPVAVMDPVSHVPQSAFDAVGAPAGLAAPKATPRSTAPLTAAGGKPLVVYVGAEYCPFCAAERWPLVVALSRFGTFTNLKVTHSGPAPEVYPNTRTFSFLGATYSSPYLAFSSVETEGNEPVNGSYPKLETPTDLQKQLVVTYDKPPYTSSTGGIPFLDYGNRYILSGASYNPQVLSGLTESQIAEALSDPTQVQAEAIDGTANIITAALCQLTGDQPATVCATPGVRAGAARLSAAK